MRQLWFNLYAITVVFLQIACTSPKPLEQATGTQSIQVMTYNVHHCNPPEKAGIIDVDAIAAVISEQRADIVAVQEVDVNTNRSGKIDEAALLAAKAGYPYYFFGKAMDYDQGQYGVLVLSKFPIADTQTYHLPKAEMKGGEPRVLAAVTLTLPGGKSIRFGSTHLEAFNSVSRLMQIEEINRIAGKTLLPFIIAGDMNATVGSDVIRSLDTQFTRTCSNCPSTFWEGNETGAIDFIGFKPQDAFMVLSHRVVQNKEASDHMPVVAELKFK